MFEENFTLWLKEAGLLYKRKVLANTLKSDVRTNLDCILNNDQINGIFDYGLSKDGYSDFTNTYHYEGYIQHLMVGFQVEFDKGHWKITFTLNHHKFRATAIYNYKVFGNEVTYGDIYDCILNNLEEIHTLYILHKHKLYKWKFFEESVYEEFRNDRNI